MRTGSNQEYQKEYYRRNKERLQQRKKERYESDKEYRDALKETSRRQSRLRSDIRKMRRQDHKIRHNGKLEPALTLPDAIREGVVNRELSVIRKWAQKSVGIVPRPRYRNAKNYPAFSLSQMRFLGALLNKIDTGKVQITYRDMKHILADVWGKTFSMTLLNTTIQEVLHGKYFEEDYKEDRRKQKQTGRKARPPQEVPSSR